VNIPFDPSKVNQHTVSTKMSGISLKDGQGSPMKETIEKMK
jgi:hypothetical protein